MMFGSVISVALVEDDDTVRAANAQRLMLAGFNVSAFDGAVAALAAVDETFAGVVVSDIRMPGMDGRQLFRRLRERDADLPVILITGHADIAEAVEALHEGAYDYLAKPFNADRLIESIRRAIDKRRLVLDNRALQAAAARADANGALIGESVAIERLRATIQQVGDAEVDVLVEGETGTGKELVARLLHRCGRRRSRPFVPIAFAAMPEHMVESELFGHESGAFAGAMRRRTGRIQSAHRGTLFLDEIESMPLSMQGKLLRVLEEREVTPLGSNDAELVDIRVVAAGRDGLETLVNDGSFRRDLFYRLDVVRLRVPPLRERRVDIPLLFASLLAEAADRFRRPPPALTDRVRSRLVDHDWPGNVRELGHFAERLVLGVDQIAPPEPAAAVQSLPERVSSFEARLIREALTAHGGDVRTTLEALGIPRKTFYDKVSRHGIDLDQYRATA